MKKSLPILVTIFTIILLFNQILAMALIEPLSKKIGNSANIGLVMVYSFCTLNIILLITIILLSWISNVKVSFICSILIILFFAINIFSIFIVTWIFGLVNIIFGIGLLIIAIINLKIQRHLI